MLTQVIFAMRRTAHLREWILTLIPSYILSRKRQLGFNSVNTRGYDIFRNNNNTHRLLIAFALSFFLIVP